MGTALQVEHPRHGRGTVKRLLDGGRRMLVRFEGSPVPRVIGPRPVEQMAPEAPRPAQPLPTADARQALEALRVGVVPATGLEQLTVGRHEELARVDRMLAQRGGLTVVCGRYGQGKTHMLELAAARALDSNWLVARATFDPVEVPPSHPLRLYAALVRGLAYPDGSGSGLRPLLERLGDSERHVHGDRCHRWLGPALLAVHRADPVLADEVLEWVSGHHRSDYRTLLQRLQRLGYRGPAGYALADWRTFGQVMAHLLGGIATWARDAGYGGLLVLLDEAEYLDQLGSTSRAMAHNVLRYLAMATLPRADLAFDPDAVYRGGHPVHRRIEARFTSDQPLAVMAAFTPNRPLDRTLGQVFAGTRQRIDLEPIGTAELQAMCDGVTALVAAARPGEDLPAALGQALRRAVADAHSIGDVDDPRQAARMAVEFWDIQRHAGDRAALEALGP
jgi:hypothetical protein